MLVDRDNIDINAKPILRWAGSKRNIVHILANFWPNNNARYIEPFCGSAALYYRLRPDKAVLSDINENLIRFYQDCVENPYAIWQFLNEQPRNKNNYYRLRDEFNNLSPSLRRSSIFLYLNRNCFNGIYRTNLSGSFNVPFSGQRTPKNPDWPFFKECCSALSSARFMDGDFEQIIEQEVRRGDFVFLDPPYATNNKRTFAEYHQNSFAVPDIDRVVQALNTIDKRGAFFLCTYDASQVGSFSAVRHWFIDELNVNRNIAGFVGSRKTAKEVLFSNVQ